MGQVRSVDCAPGRAVGNSVRVQFAAAFIAKRLGLSLYAVR
jgi:hypothetical protein